MIFGRYPAGRAIRYIFLHFQAKKDAAFIANAASNAAFSKEQTTIHHSYSDVNNPQKPQRKH